MTKGDNALVVFVKAPVPGAVKTRLWPPVSPERAAALYRAFTGDTLTQAQRVGSARLFVAYEAHARFPNLSWLPTSPPAFPQEGETLGERLERAFHACLSRHSKVLVVGSDAPHVPASIYEQAFESLEHADLVLGPSQDGGYYLIGLKRPEPRLFQAIPWSTGSVLKATWQRADQLGLITRLLPEQFDIDSFADLERLAGLLASGRASAPCTKAALADQDMIHPGLK